VSGIKQFLTSQRADHEVVNCQALNILTNQKADHEVVACQALNILTNQRADRRIQKLSGLEQSLTIQQPFHHSWEIFFFILCRCQNDRYRNNVTDNIFMILEISQNPCDRGDIKK
jgi:hypothetical protein